MRFLHQLLKSFLIVALVTAATDALAASPAPVVIDWSKGDVQDTVESCRDFTFTHMKDKHVYNFYVRGKVSDTCSFHADGLVFRVPPNYGATDAGQTTVYSFVRVGADVLVSWIPGY
jgi:hypothetical protein